MSCLVAENLHYYVKLKAVDIVSNSLLNSAGQLQICGYVARTLSTKVGTTDRDIPVIIAGACLNEIGD